MPTSLATIPRHDEPLLSRPRWGLVQLLAVPTVLSLANLLWPHGPAINAATPATSSAVATATSGQVAVSAPPIMAPAIEAEYRHAVRLFRAAALPPPTGALRSLPMPAMCHLRASPW